MTIRMIGTLGMILAVLGLVETAGASPSVDFKARVTPLAGFPNTGNLAGGGAALQFEFGFSGDEYRGFAPPLTRLVVALPEGVELHPQGFPTCTLSVLEPVSPSPHSCPRGSSAGSAGSTTAFVAFGPEVVRETATVDTHYAPGGGLSLHLFGNEPVLLEISSQGRFVESKGRHSKQLEAEIPLIETVPGAQDASFQNISFGFGTAAREKGRTIYYLTMPTRCPEGFLPFRAEARFAGLGGLAEQAVTSDYKAPCPGPGPKEGVPEPLAGTRGVITAPFRCISRRDFRIHIQEIENLVYERVTVELNGRPVKVIRGQRHSAQIDLRGLPKGTYVTRISVETDTGRLISGTRTYRTCPVRSSHAKRSQRR